MKSKLLAAAAAMTVGLGAAGAASADVWRAFVIENYFGDEATSAQYIANEENAVYIGEMSTPNFNSMGTDSYTIGSWLATGGVSYAGPVAGDTMANTLWGFYDTTLFASAPTATIAHDDGLQAYWQSILGTAYSGFTSGPTGAEVEVGTCPSCTGEGLFGFVYYENAAAPAILDVISLSSVPEPATWGLMLLGLGGIGAALRVRGKKAVA